MSHNKYYFNPNTLQYEKYKSSNFKKLLNFFGFLSLSLFLAITLVITFFQHYDTPQERMLQQEVNHYSSQFKSLQERLDMISNQVGELEERDNEIYRAIFEADPIPSSVRKGGFGGVDRYEDLQGYDQSDLIINTTQNIDKLDNKLQILSNSFKEIKSLARENQDMLSSLPAIQPVSNEELSRIASGFGDRVHPIYRTVQHHDGLDFAAPPGTEIFATGDGTVTKAVRSNRGYGNRVEIDHGYGYETLYAHLNEIKVSRGDEIKRGELIGTVGNTGMSSAPHLHYEVHKNGRPIDPKNFFHNDLSPEEYDIVVRLANQAKQSMD